ncbi:HAD-IB family hydrolase [Clostridium sp.]|uniref:HAD-IB family hydrolase n=1 Tax=Clostridium sp. TaxID=1506 RepID=UPI003217B814
MGKVAAFFDIDGTIYREGLITEVFKKIIKYELVEEDKWYNEVRPAFSKWDIRQGDYDTYLLKMIDVYIEATKGLSKEHIEHIARNVINQKGDRVYTFSRDKIKWHMELVREMAGKYEMDDFRGTIYKADNYGKYTGEIIPMWDSVSKENALMELKEKYDIDLSESYAYGDTSGDLTMFKSVGKPYAINPTKELISKIIEDEEVKKKINLIVERKDVIYKLDINNLELI